MENANADWRNDVATSNAPTLKIKDKEIARFVFMNEGERKESIDYGSSVAFLVRCDGEDSNKVFYVKSNNFAFLKQIKELGDSLRGLHVEVSRTGTKKSDTRYTVKKI